MDTYQFNDSANDVFQREPYSVKFRLHDAGLSVIFVNENENENGEKRENNEFVSEN